MAWPEALAANDVSDPSREVKQSVAEAERVHPSTVGKWRRRFAVDRLEGFCDAPRT